MRPVVRLRLSMASDYCETFMQQYVDGDTNVTCWWGITGDSVSFLVFDRTNGLADHAQIRLQASDNGNVAILTTTAGEERLNGCGEFVEINTDATRRVPAQMSTNELNAYLDSTDYALGVDGVDAFLADRRRTTI